MVVGPQGELAYLRNMVVHRPGQRCSVHIYLENRAGGIYIFFKIIHFHNLESKETWIVFNSAEFERVLLKEIINFG